MVMTCIGNGGIRVTTSKKHSKLVYESEPKSECLVGAQAPMRCTSLSSHPEIWLYFT